MNELTTRLYKIDFKYLIKNCTRKELWGKSWIVYDYDNFSVETKLSRIDISLSRLELSVGRIWGSVDIPLSDDHFNETVFKKSLESRIIACISNEESKIIQNMPIYKQAETYDRQLKSDLREQAKSFLDSNGVVNEAIRDAYIDYYLDDKFESFSNRVLSDMLEKVTPQRYLMLYTQFEDKPNYDRIIKKNEDVENLVSNFEEELNNMNIEYDTIIEDLGKEMPDIIG